MEEADRKAELAKFLKYKTYEGFRERGYPLTQKYKDRIEYELGVIESCGFSEYFLIVADLCRFMREKGIRHMPRGSGAGSVVIWGIGITHRWIDPVEYDIPFERFLNPQRVSNPDIDIDIQDDRRHEVVAYTIEKYGANKVARIITFSLLAAKSAVKDIARALNLPNYQELGDNISMLIPSGKGDDGKNWRLDDVLAQNEALRDYEKQYPELFKYARRCEGKARHPGIHAAGTIICPDDTTKYLPMFFKGDPAAREESDWFPTTQWDMYDVEERGLLKMDYLGLKTLRVITETMVSVNIIKKALGDTDTFDIDYVDRKDPKAWEMLAGGRLAGVFQVERNFVREFARRMALMVKKDPWQLAVLVAIIRPGMMDSGNTEAYLRRCMGQEEPTPPHPLLLETFKKTFGLMCFQEDVMATCVDFAGMTKAEADVVRKGVGKKAPEFIAKQQPMFFEGGMQPRIRVVFETLFGDKEVITKPRNPELVAMVAKSDYTSIDGNGQLQGKREFQTTLGVEALKIKSCDILMAGATREECEYVWSLIEAHSRYSFNNAHAAVYGMVGSYQTAYLKANWPLPYMISLINSEAGVTDRIAGYNFKVAEYIDEARSLGLKIYQPCVLRSRTKCSLVWHDQAIRFGLTLIKKVSNGAAEWITNPQTGCQKTTSLKEFILHCYARERQQTEAGPGEWKVYSKVGKGDLEALTLAGAFDCFDPDRGRVMAMLPELQKIAHKYHDQQCKIDNGKKTKLKPEQVLQTLTEYVVDEDKLKDLTLEQMLENEREYTGCFLSESPFEPFRHQIMRNATCTPSGLMNEDADVPNGYLVFAGLAADVKPITIKNGKNKGKPMGIIKFIGTAGSMEVVAFTDTWNNILQTEPLGPERNKVYLVQVVPDNRNIGKFICQQLQRLSNTGVAT